MSSANGKLTLQVAAISLLLLALAPVGKSDGAGEQETDLEFVERILSYVNNNEVCTLPTVKQVDEVFRVFEETQKKVGDNFEASLSDDQKLFSRTVLKEWESFNETMNQPVMIKSTRRSMFVSRIEYYQEEKFGSSVCLRFKHKPGPVTDRIFEKNPVVRYLKHLETGQVVNPPSKAELEAQARVKAELIAKARAEEAARMRAEAEARAKAEAEARAKAEAEARAQKETELRIKSEEEAKLEAEAKRRAEAEELARAEEKARLEKEETKRQVEAEERAKAEAERLRLEAEEQARLESEHKAQAGAVDESNVEETEESAMKDVKHNYIGEFVFEFDEAPTSMTIVIEHENGTGDQDEDPLADVPVPHFYEGDKEANGGAVDQVKYFDAEQDDADLDKLVAVPELDMHYDTMYGYFKWPDECQHLPKGTRDACDGNLKLDEEALGLGGVWDQFLDDPYRFDREQQKARIKNAARTNAERQRLVEERLDSDRRARLFGHDTLDKVPEIVWPLGVNPDRWRYLANNNYCKIGFNQGRIVHSTKSGYKTVMSFTKTALVSSRKHLLSGKK